MVSEMDSAFIAARKAIKQAKIEMEKQGVTSEPEIELKLFDDVAELLSKHPDFSVFADPLKEHNSRIFALKSNLEKEGYKVFLNKPYRLGMHIGNLPGSYKNGIGWVALSMDYKARASGTVQFLPCDDE